MTTTSRERKLELELRKLRAQYGVIVEFHEELLLERDRLSNDLIDACKERVQLQVELIRCQRKVRDLEA